MFKEGVGSVFLRLADTCYIQQTCSFFVDKFYKLSESTGSDWRRLSGKIMLLCLDLPRNNDSRGPTLSSVSAPALCQAT